MAVYFGVGMIPAAISSYLKKIERALQRGDATEHTYRPALKCLIESLGDGITATNEPKRVACGAPDFIVTRGQTPLGYIEAKDIGKALDRIEKTDSFKRYLGSLGNLILTDYLEFRWYVEGEHRRTAGLARVGKDGKLKRDEEGTQQVEAVLDEFLQVRAPTISGPKELARRMASLARLIRDITGEALKAEEKGGMLHEQLEGFRKVLIHNLTHDEFADMYAQTICYGLFAARCNFLGKQPFTREHAAYDLPKTNPFLRKIFSEMAGPNLDDRIAWAVDDLAELLNRADIAAILRDFGKRTRQEDPVLHFYETFLAAFDPKMREARGVYYTPEPVVSYIVRSVDHILKTDFGLQAGLADTSKVQFPRVVDDPKTGKPREVTEECHKVLILDPAVGTGTFLHGVIDQIHDHIVGMGQKGTWSGYVSEHLLPRLYGFELLMAPYTMAHMKLGIQLRDLGYDFQSKERLKIFLTNTLEEAYESSEHLFAKWLVEEANAAVKVKLDLPILVVLGNPPYSGHSANKGKWIEELLRGKDTRTGEQTESYFEVDGHKLRERNPKWLNDDYVKFIRFAQWRIERTGYGILAFISNHGYIDNPTFRGMRQSLMDTFDDIYVLDLHGNSKKKERCPDGSKDENVFDIQQGVAIGVFVKRKGTGKKKPASVNHADLWGLRNNKYHHLWESQVARTEWAKLEPTSPFYLFVPQDIGLLAEYSQGWRILDALPVNSVGIVTARDKLTIHWSEKELMETVRDFSSLPAEEARQKYDLGKDVEDWNVDLAQKDLLDHKLSKKHDALVLYRPFDQRHTFYTGRSRGFICRPRAEVMHHMLAGQNIGLISARSNKSQAADHFFCTRFIMETKCGESTTQSCIFPLYSYSSPERENLYSDEPTNAPGGRQPNLARQFIEDFAKRLKMTFITDGKGDLKSTFGPEDIFDYMYAVFHSRTYRSRYAGFLKIDFPRLPLTSKRDLFRELCALGEELVGLHLMEKHGPAMTRFDIEGDNVVEKVRYTEPGQGAEEGRVWINKTQYFKGVPPDVWEFHIGGYQVCDKWLKDRKGRKLTYDDITHYQNIVSALSETIRLMAEIDDAIDRLGGWPIA